MKNRGTAMRLRPIMLGGTGSDVGKSVLAAGLCRIFLQDGFTPAPFKAQNMALNSYVTPDGFEIGRAQAVQAEAAGLPCSYDMNPVLLKPSGCMVSQVILNGLPIGNRSAADYHCDLAPRLRKEVHAAFDRLSSRYNPVVIEGAGSIAEINLRKYDIVNMSMAEYADAAVILVADIDRGGVFASVYGTLMLLPPDERVRIKGIIINKFRGDEKLFEEGRIMMEEICGIPVLGVIPFLEDIHIEEEDSVSLAGKSFRPVTGKIINVAVVSHPQMSNFTDFDTIARSERTHVYFTSEPSALEEADIIILPGTKNTISDLRALRRTGCAAVIIRKASEGTNIVGICGGYQMLGMEITDPCGVEGEMEKEAGLGLLPVFTEISSDKTLGRVKFGFRTGETVAFEGYEIHNGKSEVAGVPWFHKEDGSPEGCTDGKNIFGSYIHGLLDNPGVIDEVLKNAAHKKGLSLKEDILSYTAYKERQYDKLAEVLRTRLDMEKLYRIIQS